MERLPLGANGKVDRNSLPAPQWEAESDQGYIAPQTPIEEALADIFANVLDVHEATKTAFHDIASCFNSFLELRGKVFMDMIRCVPYTIIDGSRQ